MQDKVTCRPCKEQPNTWEIVKPNGKVSSTHYKTKRECITAGEEMANEYACELFIENEPKQNNKNTNNKN